MSAPVFIHGLGLMTPLGLDPETTFSALASGKCGLAPLSLFSLCQNNPLPVGQVPVAEEEHGLPRTHRLALSAARQALEGRREPPGAIVIGTTTGGMLTSEPLLRRGETDPHGYRYHGLESVARLLASELACEGPLLTVSTACSSGALAVALGMALIRQGRAGTVLAGGVDSLCRLTYFGFHSLQLVDPAGSRPLDRERRGMSVAEGAGFLLLGSEPAGALAELAGAGLSCDAHHPAAPHPEGRGAAAAMQAALADAGVEPGQVDAINLHGTGTVENDAAECRAVVTLFSDPPPLSSIKGATGHCLAAAGAIEAAVATLCIRNGLVPANIGLVTPDPTLAVKPLAEPLPGPVDRVLSNSFGFGGNNVSLLIARTGRPAGRDSLDETSPLYIHAVTGLSGAGLLPATLARFCARRSAAGQADDSEICKRLNGKTIRRLGRLSRMALGLAREIEQDLEDETVDSVFLGTGWGGLSETDGFLGRLFASEERFPSPIDFVGSVHNAAAGQVAIMLAAKGANITTSGGDASFEEALLAAELTLSHDQAGLLMGVDEAHARLSPLFDSSVRECGPADGGAAFLVRRSPGPVPLSVRLVEHGPAGEPLLERMGRFLAETSCRRRLLLVGMPAGVREQAEEQLALVLAHGGYDGPCLDYRALLGQFASASALAAAVAAGLLVDAGAASVLLGGRAGPGDAIYLLGLGRSASLVELALR